MSNTIKDLYWKMLIVEREQVRQVNGIIKIIYQSYEVFLSDYGSMDNIEDCDVYEIIDGKIVHAHVIA